MKVSNGNYLWGITVGIGSMSAAPFIFGRSAAEKSIPTAIVLLVIAGLISAIVCFFTKEEGTKVNDTTIDLNGVEIIKTKESVRIKLPKMKKKDILKFHKILEDLVGEKFDLFVGGKEVSIGELV